MLHLIDLDGAFGDNRRNQELISEMIQELSIPIEMVVGYEARKMPPNSLILV